MAEVIKQIQLHRAGESNEKWMPNTYSSYITIKNLQHPDTTLSNDMPLNIALENIKIAATNAKGQIGISSGGSTSLFLNQAGGWTAPSGGGSGDITGSGTSGAIAKFNGTKSITTSIITESGTSISVGGDISATGNVTCFANSSDRRLKTDIEPFKGLDIIGNLNFVKFKWNETACGLNGYYKNDAVNYGVIAQDSEDVIDGFVFDMAGGYKGVRYEKLIPIMAQAIKELKGEIEELKQQLKK